MLLELKNENLWKRWNLFGLMKSYTDMKQIYFKKSIPQIWGQTALRKKNPDRTNNTGCKREGDAELKGAELIICCSHKKEKTGYHAKRNNTSCTQGWRCITSRDTSQKRKMKDKIVHIKARSSDALLQEAKISSTALLSRKMPVLAPAWRHLTSSCSMLLILLLKPPRICVFWYLCICIFLYLCI